MPDVIFGPNAFFAIKRWPEPEDWTALAAGLGVTHVQFCFDLLDPMLAGPDADYARIRRACEANGIELPSAFTGFIGYIQSLLGHPDAAYRARAEEWYGLAIAAAARLGCRAVGGHVGTLNVGEFSDADARARGVARTREAVLRLTEVCARHGLEAFLWEVMPQAREWPASMDDVDELLETVDSAGAVPVRLCLDVGHACLAGAPAAEQDPYAWLERFGAHAHTIHLQQTDGEGDYHWPFTERFNALGIIKPERVMEIVARLPQDSVELMLETLTAFEATDERALADLRESLDFWRPAIERHHHDQTTQGEAA